MSRKTKRKTTISWGGGLKRHTHKHPWLLCHNCPHLHGKVKPQHGATVERVMATSRVDDQPQRGQDRPWRGTAPEDVDEKSRVAPGKTCFRSALSRPVNSSRVLQDSLQEIGDRRQVVNTRKMRGDESLDHTGMNEIQRSHLSWHIAR